MTIQQALSFTGNQYQAMSYEELAEVTKALAEVARKRLSRLQEGTAYMKMYNLSTGKNTSKKVNALSINKKGNISISKRFKGKNKMKMSDLRTLRKVLYDYLKDPTSTKRGLEEFRQEAERMRIEREKPLDIGDDWMTPQTDWDLFDRAITDTDLIEFAQNRLDWLSDQIFNAIMECGGYEQLGTNSFNDRLRKFIERELEQIVGSRNPEEPMADFFYEE